MKKHPREHLFTDKHDESVEDQDNDAKVWVLDATP